MKQFQRLLCAFLTVIMLLGLVPGALRTEAVAEDGLCAVHHPRHDADCGYAEGAAAGECSHSVCDETCLTQETVLCVFEHVDCGCTETETCGHVCTVESGCVTMQCSHVHDDLCGYTEPVEAAACAFAGVSCQQCALEQTPAPAAESVTVPMIAKIGGSDGRVNILDSMIQDGNSTGPWLTLHAGMDSEEAFTGFVSSDTDVVEIETNPYYPSIRFICKNQGTAIITHTEGDITYTFSVTVTEPEPPRLQARVDDQGPPVGGKWQLAPGSVCQVKFYLGTNRQTMVDVEGGPYTSLTTVQVENNDGVIELVPAENRFYTIRALKNGSATLVYAEGENRYTLDVFVQEPEFRMIPVQPEGTPNWIDVTGLKAGQSMNLRCVLAELYGPPVSGALMGLTSSDEDIFTLSLSNEQTGVYTLTAVGAGVAEILWQDGEKVYSCEVIVMERNFKVDGMVYFPAVDYSSKKTFPNTVINLEPGNIFGKEFYYSEPSEAMLLAEGELELTPLTIDDVTWSGPILVEQFDNDSNLYITALEQGTGYLEVTSGGITHSFVVNVGRSRPDTEVQEGGYMWLNNDVVVGFGNPGIVSDGDNNAEPGVLKMRAQINSGFGSNTPDDYQYREPMCFAAMDKTNGVVAADVMEAVSNVSFSVLACRNTDGTQVPYPSVELANCEQVALTEGNVSAWTNYLVAGGKKAFKGLVGMTFDLPDTNAAGQSITRRMSLYIFTHNTYMGQDVRVEANVESAAQLNVILSSYEALKTWIKAEYPEYEDVVDGVCNVDLKLPHADLTDTVVVSEAIAPFPYQPNPPSNPNFRIYLIGPRQGKRVTLAGLVSRGSLAGVFDVQFEAQEDVQMTRGEETFTCGLMADAKWSGNVVYDMEFAQRYGIDPYANKRSVYDWKNDGGMHYADCDILSVEGCSFNGFDYGTRSTPNGYVGGGEGNAFSKCFYGIYIDCQDKIGWGEITYTGFSGYDFKKNVVAVRIVGLQDNVTPYEFRIHHCDFINNYLEFWIDKYDTTYLQNYYFYANHFSGGWNKVTGQWYKYGSDTLGNEVLPEIGHHGPKYHEAMNNGVEILVSASPCKAVANLEVNRSASEDGYWIYGGEDQVTRIEVNGDELPILQESLENLSMDAEVSVVTNQGRDTVAVWTFEGGE